MLAGHFGIGLALKSRYTSVPLAAILAGAVLPDLLWCFYHALGLESLQAPPSSLLRPDTLGTMRFSHDVSMALLYAGIAAAAGMLAASWAWSAALALGILSHVGLDLLVHAPVLGVAGPWLPLGVGLDLWRRAPAAAWGIEMVVVLAGGSLYLRSHASAGPGRTRARAAVLLLAVAHVAGLAA